jgi:hypothetical protein
LGDLMKIPKWNPDSCNPTVLKVSKIICLYFEKNMKKSHPYVSLIENYRCIFLNIYDHVEKIWKIYLGELLPWKFAMRNNLYFNCRKMIKLRQLRTNLVGHSSQYFLPCMRVVGWTRGRAGPVRLIVNWS